MKNARFFTVCAVIFTAVVSFEFVVGWADHICKEKSLENLQNVAVWFSHQFVIVAISMIPIGLLLLVLTTISSIRRKSLDVVAWVSGGVIGIMIAVVLYNHLVVDTLIEFCIANLFQVAVPVVYRLCIPKRAHALSPVSAV